MVRFQNLQCKANVHHHAFLQAIQTVPCWQSHRHFGLNSQPLFGSCPGSMTHSREGPWERAEKRLGVQATFTLPSWKSGKRKYQLPLPALSAGESEGGSAGRVHRRYSFYIFCRPLVTATVTMPNVGSIWRVLSCDHFSTHKACGFVWVIRFVVLEF